LSTIRILNSIKQPRVRPEDCTLLFGIPLDYEKFCADLRDPSKDFARQFSHGRQMLPDSALWSLYRPYATQATKMAREVADLGVEVVFDVTLDKFVASLNDRPITTIIAHWRSAIFRPEDILSPLDLKASVIEKAGNLITQYGSDGYKRLSATFSSTVDRGADSRALIANELSMFLLEVPAPFVSEAGTGDTRLGRVTRYLFELDRRRQQLENLIPGMFSGGSSMEFGDKLHSLREVVESISINYSGILDLTVCNSVMVGEAIRRKCAKALVLMSEEVTQLDFRLALYKQLIHYLARHDATYIDATILLRRHLAGH
jgi:hypothetical protein